MCGHWAKDGDKKSVVNVRNLLRNPEW